MSSDNLDSPQQSGPIRPRLIAPTPTPAAQPIQAAPQARQANDQTRIQPPPMGQAEPARAPQATAPQRPVTEEPHQAGVVSILGKSFGSPTFALLVASVSLLGLCACGIGFIGALVGEFALVQPERKKFREAGKPIPATLVAATVLNCFTVGSAVLFYILATVYSLSHVSSS